jgi:pantoate kinase
MKPKKALAFAPGHISGFFEPIFVKNDFLKTGSRGAGINISLGAKSEVIVNKSNELKFEIFLNGKKSSFPLIPTALKYLVEKKSLEIIIKTKLDLPISQGFGMSAASVVSASFALSKIVNKSYFEALKASHFAESLHKTGLGDVISCFFGGIEIRTMPGLPPYGVIQHIIGDYELVLCVLGDKINTKEILNNPDKLKLISRYGNYCTEKLKESPTIENLFSLSQFFTKKTLLGSRKVIDAIQMINDVGSASMCMLGNSIFALGDTNKICDILKPFGKIFICRVNKSGAIILSI